MDRRRFLTEGAALGGLIALPAAALAGRRYLARRAVAADLTDAARPPLAAKAERELTALPAHAWERVRAEFDRLCLNAHRFVKRVGSAGFAADLARCRVPAARDALYDQAFFETVAAPDEVLAAVRGIAAGVGREPGRGLGGLPAGRVGRLGRPPGGGRIAARPGRPAGPAGRGRPRGGRA